MGSPRPSLKSGVTVELDVTRPHRDSSPLVPTCNLQQKNLRFVLFMPTLRSEAGTMTDPPDRSVIFNEASIHDGSDVAAGPVVPVLNPVPQEDHDPAFVTFPETYTRVEPDTSAGVYPPAPDKS